MKTAKICAQKHKNATFFECFWIFAKNRRRGDTTKRQPAPGNKSLDIVDGTAIIPTATIIERLARIAGLLAEYHSH